MNILAVTDDHQCIAVISTAIHLRWPNSGEAIFLSEPEQAFNLDLKEFDTIIFDGMFKDLAVYVINSIRKLSVIPLLYLADPSEDQMDTAEILAFEKTDYLFKPLQLGDLISVIEANAQCNEEMLSLHAWLPSPNKVESCN